MFALRERGTDVGTEVRQALSDPEQHVTLRRHRRA